MTKVMNTYSVCTGIYMIKVNEVVGKTTSSAIRSGKNYGEIRADIVRLGFNLDNAEETYKVNNYGKWEDVEKF